MKKVLLVVGHQKSAQGAVNSALGVSEWEFNSKLVQSIAALLGEQADTLLVDVPHWKKAPLINAKHAKTPYEAVLEFHLNSCDADKKVNYCLMKYAAGSPRGKSLSTRLIDALVGMGLKPANWQETDPRGVFPTERPPAKSDKTVDWWDKNGWRYRGATFLWKTNPPAVLLEPFFISCTEWMKTIQHPDRLAELADNLAAAIRAFLNEGGGTNGV